MNYWILVAAPDKWFCDQCQENSQVNDALLNLSIQQWRVREDYFRNAQIGDKCVIKVGKDFRSIERRTLKDGSIVELLKSGIYAFGEIIEALYYDESDKCHRIKISTTKNLFKGNIVIDQELAEKTLGTDFLSQSSKKLDEAKYKRLEALIEIEENSDFSGDEDVKSENYDDEENTTIYPADVKIQRDMFSVRELKTDYQDKKLILAPDFQREAVWTIKQKSELVESILMGIPLPMIYFFEGDGGVIQVVDGKQRLTALFEFLDNKFPLSSSLQILKHLRSKKYKDLESAEQTKIARFQFVAQTIIPPTPDRIKFDIFERVNRKGSMLNNQEMRNALYQGKSTELLNRLADSEVFKNATGNGISPTRMKDRYMILRFLAFYLWREKKLIAKKGEVAVYRSDMDEFLGIAMDNLNKMDDTTIENLAKLFEKAMRLSYKIGGSDIFRIPGSERKRPINMALFESFGYFFSKLDESAVCDSCKEKLFELFKDNSFMESITVRLDSTPSVKTRFDKVSSLLGGNLDDK